MSKVDKIVALISEKFNVPKEKVLKEIKEKIEEFGGLVSEEGAAMLVARDYGLDIREIAKSKVSDLVSGIKNIALTLRVFKISEEKKFERKDGKIGKLKIVYAGDETGYTRILFWDEQIENLNKIGINVGDVITIYNPKVKENIFGSFDLFITQNTKIEKDSENLPSVEDLLSNFLKKEYKRIELREIESGFVEAVGIVSKIYKLRTFEVCPICKAKIKENKCPIHGEVEKEVEYVLSFELDDFTSNVRVALFRDNVRKFLGIEKIEENIDLNKHLGKLIGVRGRAKINKIFNRFEIIADEIFEPNINDEIIELIENYGKEY